MYGVRLRKELIFILGIFIWVIVRGIVLIIRKKKNIRTSIRREILMNILIIYILALLGVTLFPIYISFREYSHSITVFNVNYIPFRSVVSDINQLGESPSFAYGFHIKLLVKNLVGNLILLTPLGVLLPILWEKYRSFKKCVLLGIVVTFSIEILQLIEGICGIGAFRVTDIDDIILNTIGVIIGYMVFKAIKKYLTLAQS